MKVKIPRIGGGTVQALVSSISEALSLRSGLQGVVPSELAAWKQIAQVSTSADEFAEAYLREQVFSKWASDDDRDELTRKAVIKLVETETACATMNYRFTGWEIDTNIDQTLFRRARHLVRKVLGPFCWEEFPASCRFGPGASSSIRARYACHQTKWQCSEHITAAAIPYYQAFRQWAGLDDLPSKLEVVGGNRVTTVPKNWKSRRIIAVEPDWNMFFQLGVGKMLRRRLQRVGLLHPTAQERNRELARKGSVTGLLATIDLSSASDMIPLALCEAILPPDWFQVINDLRSPEGVLPDGATTLQYEKVSSMGNGFTFELETLIFWALVSAACGKDSREYVSVYGDDIICPSEYYTDVTAALTMCGFRVNPDKSFSNGPFRESCGGHYWAGTDVTPFYVKEPPATAGEVIDLGNRIQAYLARRGWSKHPTLHSVVHQMRSHIPRQFRGPSDATSMFSSPWDLATPSYDPDGQFFFGYGIERARKSSDISDSVGALLMKLWYVDDELQPSRLPRSLRRERVVRVWVGSQQWTHPSHDGCAVRLD